MGGGLSPALPILIQIPVFLFLSAVKSLLYNFNFLQGLIPWSVVAQALNPCTQPLDRRTAAAPDPAGLREASFCSQFLLYTPQAFFSSLAFKMPHTHPLPAKPSPGLWWVAHPRERLQAKKTAWWENPGSVVFIPLPTPHQVFSTLLSWMVLWIPK